jgi:hypothetical protein
MKKMLILMLVLGVVSVASAAVMTLQISVNGVQNPTDSQIFVLPSQSAELDVWTPNGYDGVDTYFGLVLSDATAGNGTIVGGTCHIPPAPDLSSMVFDMSEFFPGDGGVFGFIGSSTGVATAAGIYFDQILFHCESTADAVIQLWSNTGAEGAPFILEDTVIIHQIPEPATIALLSLGGLLLRKRK